MGEPEGHSGRESHFCVSLPFLDADLPLLLQGRGGPSARTPVFLQNQIEKGDDVEKREE